MQRDSQYEYHIKRHCPPEGTAPVHRPEDDLVIVVVVVAMFGVKSSSLI